jgi:hypothetical protein
MAVWKGFFLKKNLGSVSFERENWWPFFKFTLSALHELSLICCRVSKYILGSKFNFSATWIAPKL